jgi:transposase
MPRSTIGSDIAKQVFQVHWADASGHVMFRKRLTRSRLIEFFRSQPHCFVALEACGGAHHWGREIAKLWAQSRLAPVAVRLAQDHDVVKALAPNQSDQSRMPMVCSRLVNATPYDVPRSRIR